jgi:hypothetical protein
VSPSPHPDRDGGPAIASDVTGLALDDGGFVVYDPTREDAWLQSDAPVDLSDRR